MTELICEQGHLRVRLGAWLERPSVQNALIALILANAAILGLETSAAVMARWGSALVAADRALLAVFVVEIAARIYVHRTAFFRDPWSVFDLIVVGIALLPASGPFAILRALRVLRVLRLLTMVPSMRRVVAGLLAAIPGLSSVVAIIGILFYVAAVIATKLFGQSFPEWFGTLGASAYTLFQIMTLESWSMGIVRPVMEQFPQAWLFFVPFIMISTFTMLNLFIAVIVNAIQTAQHSGANGVAPPVASDCGADAEASNSALHRELVTIRTELGDLRRLLSANTAGPPR